MDSTLPIAHLRLQEWYELPGQFENAREGGVDTFPELLKLRSQPSAEEYWGGLLDVARTRTEPGGETCTERMMQADA